MKEKISKVLAGLLAVVLVLSGMVFVGDKEVKAADDVSFSFEVDKTEVKPGDTVTVKIFVSSSKPIYAFAANIDVDEGVYNTPLQTSFTPTLPEEVADAVQVIWAPGKGGSSLALLSDPVEIDPDDPSLGYKWPPITTGEKTQVGILKLKVKKSPESTSGVINAAVSEMQTGPAEGFTGDSYDSVSGSPVDSVAAPTTGSQVTDSTGTVLENNAVTVEITLESLAMNKTELALEKGKSEQLTVTAVPEAAIAGQKVSWKSSDEAVAKVSEDGTVTAVGKGSAVITASVAGKDVTCNVTVSVPLTGIEISDEKITLLKNATKTLTVKAVPEDAENVPAAVWSSDNEEVASVAADGTVTAKKEGNAIITVKVGDFTKTCTVEVGEKPLKSIALNKTKATIARGETDTLTVTYNPEDTTDAKEVTWKSSDEAVAKVEANENGAVVTAVKKGEATITATTKDGKLSAECVVTVNVPLKSITMQSELGVAKNGEKTISYTLDPEDADNTNVKLSTTGEDATALIVHDPETRTIKVTGKTEGERTITVTSVEDPSIKAECKVKVSEIHLTGLKLNNQPAPMEVGATHTMGVEVIPADTTDDESVTWSSTNEDVATVDPNTGLITAVKGGVTTITATSVANGTIKAFYNVKVLTHIESIKLDNEAIELNKGETKALVPTITPVENDDDNTIVWTSSNEKVATVDENGVVTAVDAGETEITAKVAGKEATCKVTVKAPIESIELSEASLELEAGEDKELTVTYNPKNTTDEKKVTWSSSDDDIAKVDENGKVTAVKGGKATITATTANGKTASCDVKVKIHVEEMKVPTEPEKAPETLKVSQPFKMPLEIKAVGLEEKVPVEDVDDVIVYKSSNESIATVDEFGNITILDEGEVTITAYVEGKEEETKVEYKFTAEHVPVTGVEIVGKVDTLEEGKTAQLEVKFTPEDATTGKEVTWSSDEAVAVVNAEGVLETKAPGTTTITVTTEGGFTDSFELTVTAKPVPVDPEKPDDKPNQGTTDEGKPNQGTADEGKPNQGTADEGKPNQGTTDKGTTSQGTTDKVDKSKGTTTKATTDKKAPAASNGNVAVKTGDTTGFVGIVLTMILSISVIAFAVYSRSRKRNYRR